MADGGIYGRSGSVEGGLYGGASAGTTYGPPSKKKTGGKSWFGGLKNAVQGVEDIAVGATVGTGTAIKNVAEDLRDAVQGGFRPKQGQKKQPFKRTAEMGKAMGVFYKDFYGPLVKGDFDTFFDNLYEHPLQLPLDLLTIGSVTLGTGAKLRLIEQKGGTAIKLELPNGEGFVSRPLARGEMRARLQTAVLRAKNRGIRVGPYERPAGSAAAKVKQKQIARKSTNTKALNVRFNRSLLKLRGQNAHVAAFLLARFDRQALNEYTAIIRAEAANDPRGPAQATLRLLENKRVQELFNNPNQKVRNLLGEARVVGEAQKKLLNLTDEVAEASRFRAARLAGGGRWRPDPKWRPPEGIREGQRVNTPAGEGRVTGVDVDTPRGGKGIAVAVKSRDDLRPQQHRFAEDEISYPDAPGVIVGGPSIDELKARGLDPIYLPDTDTVPKTGGFSLNTGGGKGIPRRIGNTRQNEGTLMLAGQIIMDPAVLNKSFLASVKYTHYKDTHAALVEMADEWNPDMGRLPEGYEVIRQFPKEKVSHMDVAETEFMKWAEANLDPGQGDFIGPTHDLTTKSPTAADRLANGNYLVAHSKIIKQMTGDFTRQNRFIRFMNQHPLRVWRALVLNLRPAWLVNNMLGNSLMYLVHSAGREDMKQLALGFKSLTENQRAKNAIDAVLDKHFAGHTRGGYIAAEMPEFTTRNPLLRGGAAVVNFTQRIDRAWEQMLRRDKVKAELARYPGLEARVEQMGREQAFFDDLAQDPEAALANAPEMLDSPARDAFRRDLEERFGEDADAIMALTDPLAAYAAREKSVPLASAYDDMVAGVTGAEVPEGALLQTRQRPASLDSPPSSPEHSATLQALQQQWDNLEGARNAWVAAGKPKKGDTVDAKTRAMKEYEAARVDEMHQRLWDGRNKNFDRRHDAERQSVLNALRARLGNRQGAIPRRFANDADALEMFGFLDELTERGKFARFWYRNSGKAILSLMGGNKVEGAKMAQLVAIYSPQQAVVGNLGLAMRAYEAFRRGDLDALPGQDWQKTAVEQVMRGTGGWEGRKTNNFYGNLLQWIDKKKFREEGYVGNEVTSDMWMARVFGYLRDEVSGGRYDLIEEVVRQIAGERGWRPQEVQAAIWTAIKGADMDDVSANVDFAEAIERNIHTINLEVTRGVTGIGEDLDFAQTQQVIRAVAPEIKAAAAAHNLQIRSRDFSVGGAEDIRTGPAAYETGRNAAAYFEVSGAPGHVQAFVNTLADGFDRRDVWATREGSTGGGKPTIVIKHKALADPKVADKFFTALHEEMGSKAAGFAMLRDADGIQIIAPGSVTRAGLDDFGKLYAKAIDKAEAAAGLRGVRYHTTQSSVIKKKEPKSGGIRGSEGTAGGRAGSLAAGDPATLRAALERAVGSVRSGRGGGAGRAAPGRAGELSGDAAGRGVLAQDARGAFDPATRLIHLFDQADPSTAVHEFIHAVETGGGLSRAHVGVLEQWSGFKQGTREFSEAAARGFEQYLREGRAPTQALASIFARWKALLVNLYRKASDLGAPINDSVRAVFDEILVPPRRSPRTQAQRQADALDAYLTRNPDAVYAVYDRVNDALGNFDYMSPAERSVLRSLLPFYSWFKAISGVSAKLVVEQPLKLELFNHLGRTVIEENLAEMGIDRDKWPQSLVSMVGMSRDPDGRISGFNLGPFNPYMTVAQLGAFAAAVASFKPGEAGRALPGANPIGIDIASYIWGQTPQGYDVRGSGTYETLPFYRILSAFELAYGIDIPLVRPASSKDPLYEHSPRDELLRYGGVPYARVSPTAAERLTAER